MSTSDSETSFELIANRAKKADASEKSLTINQKTTEEKFQLIETKIVELEKKLDAKEDANKDQKLVAAEEHIRALYLQNQEFRALIHQIDEENSGLPVSHLIIGSWELNSLIHFNLQMKELPEEKRQRFEMLLKAETRDNVAHYSIDHGEVFFSSTLSHIECYCSGTYTNKTWTNHVTFPDGQKGEIVKSVEDGFLKMVLKSNGDEMTVIWKRFYPTYSSSPRFSTCQFGEGFCSLVICILLLLILALFLKLSD